MKKFLVLSIVIISINCFAQDNSSAPRFKVPNPETWSGWAKVDTMDYGVNVPPNVPFEYVNQFSQTGKAYVFVRPANGSSTIDAWIMIRDRNGNGRPQQITVTVSVPPVSWGSTHPNDPTDRNRSEFDNKAQLPFMDLSGNVITIYYNPSTFDADPVELTIYRYARYNGPQIPGAQNIAANWSTTDFRTVLSGALL